MKRNTCLLLSALLLAHAAMLARASDARTSASATNGVAAVPAAAATAQYSGDIGFARTDTRTGRISLARGVALAVDEHGVTLSVSTAIAPRLGPALASNFNLSINTDGRAATSTATVTASGGLTRMAAVSGGASSTRSDPSAESAGTGRSDPDGRVGVKTASRSNPVERSAPRHR
jgi:hypothetical protein